MERGKSSLAGATITLHDQRAFPIDGGEVDWKTPVWIRGRYQVIDDVADNLGHSIFVTPGEGGSEFAIDAGDLPDDLEVERPRSTTVRRLFFYGTLMSGGFRGHVGEQWGLRLLGPAKIRGDLYNVGAFPAYVTGDGEILGEVWEAPDDETLRRALVRTDAIEGYRRGDPRSMYLRETVDLLPGDGLVGQVQVYRWNYGEHGLRPIPSGSWRQLQEEQAAERERLARGFAVEDDGDETWADAVWGHSA